MLKGWAGHTISSSGKFYREIFKRDITFSPLNWGVFPAVSWEWVVWNFVPQSAIIKLKQSLIKEFNIYVFMGSGPNQSLNLLSRH